MAMDKNEIVLKVNRVYNPPRAIVDGSYIKPEEYERLYAESIKDPESFWAKIAEEELHWFRRWDRVRAGDHPYYRWFVNGKLNITYNCLDRHVKAGKRNKLAYIYINEENHEVKVTYGELLDMVNRFANGLKSLGIQRGDRVAIYMPLIVEQIVAMLACARIGALHSVVFGGFSAPALRLRIMDAQAKVVITSTWTKRRGKKIDLKSSVDEAVADLPFLEKVVVVQREGDDYELVEKEVDFHGLVKSQSSVCEPEVMDSEDPLFILYTSGTTGKPKGVLHTVGGYNVYTHYTTKIVFDLHENDIFWSTADPGWITGHSYLVYGPLSVGVTSVIAEGAPDYPDPGWWWSIIERYKVNVFYTAPTVVRLFMRYGEEWPRKYDLSSLRILGCVGEPLNPEAWIWFYEQIGKKNCALIDTWWQTETGGHMITTIPSYAAKPGKAGKPFFGIVADVVDKTGQPVAPNTVGSLVIKQPWPSGLRTCWNEPERYEKYWKTIAPYYLAGDLATKDEDGYIMFLGRADDVLNVSGHRIGTAEVESALVSHPAVAEAAVIGKPHPLKGESIKGFLILKHGQEPSELLIEDLKLHVRRELGSLAVPDELQVLDSLPKTRSGKIMRRVLKSHELGMEVGDISTLED
ncbi:MAG: acetate--CoA ligase [Methanophagales archaeon ANME-1-THS]|nr:MAG: acetate--CoA ligase [Methanophagales archaeon ANME-1-THS]